MIMNLGLPYKGSKNTIANDIVKALPRGKKLLDACCGGGAFLMAAAMSGRWEKVVGNDLNAATIALLDAVLIHKGQIEYNHPPVCSRDDFFNSLQRIENDDFDIQDCVNKYCASFGNAGKSYLYGRDIEDSKLAAERMLTAETLEERRKSYRIFFRMAMDNTRLYKLEELQRLARLEHLERLERLDIFDIDYSEFDVIYFDIPYKGTSEYEFKFNHDKFYTLFKNLKKPAFLSEYDAPFTLVSCFDKASILGANTKKIDGLEKLYFNGTIDDYKRLMGAEYKPLDEGKQIDLFKGGSMSDTISFLPMLDEMEKPEPLHVKVERRAEAICNELWEKYKGNVREYVAECVDRFAKENLPWYDLREDDRVQYDDVVGECISCGKPITARDICNVDAIHYTWVRKDGKNIHAYAHYNGVCAVKSVMDYKEFHEVYLRLTGYTDEEYIQNMKRDQPSVFYERVKAGMYDEEGHRLHPEGWLCQPKRKKRKAKEVA